MDDEPDVLMLLGEEIQSACSDCQVDNARTYEEAVERMISLTYDVVILYIMGVRGFDLLELAVSRKFPVAMLTEFAWAASRARDTYLRSKYHSLVGRRGKKRALVALGHKILIMCYHILKCRRPYKELGVDYLDQRRKDKIARSYIKRLNHLGYEVILQEAA